MNGFRSEELARSAALLIHNLKIGKITRFDVNQAIRDLPEGEQQQFKDLLNKYRAVKCG